MPDDQAPASGPHALAVELRLCRARGRARSSHAAHVHPARTGRDARDPARGCSLARASRSSVGPGAFELGGPEAGASFVLALDGARPDVWWVGLDSHLTATPEHAAWLRANGHPTPANTGTAVEVLSVYSNGASISSVRRDGAMLAVVRGHALGAYRSGRGLAVVVVVADDAHASQHTPALAD